MTRNFGTFLFPLFFLCLPPLLLLHQPLLSFPFLLLSLPPLPADAVPTSLLPSAAPLPPIIVRVLRSTSLLSLLAPALSSLALCNAPQASVPAAAPPPADPNAAANSLAHAPTCPLSFENPALPSSPPRRQTYSRRHGSSPLLLPHRRNSPNTARSAIPIVRRRFH